MENKYNNIDEIFRQSLENFSAEPPPYVWNNIDSALDKLDGKKKSRFFWLMGSFLAVASAFVGGYYLSGYLSKDNAVIVQKSNHINILGGKTIAMNERTLRSQESLSNLKNRILISEKSENNPVLQTNQKNNGKNLNSTIQRSGLKKDKQIVTSSPNKLNTKVKVQSGGNPKSVYSDKKNVTNNKGYFSLGTTKEDVKTGENTESVIDSSLFKQQETKESNNNVNNKLNSAVFSMNDAEKNNFLIEVNKDNKDYQNLISKNKNRSSITSNILAKKNRYKFNGLKEDDAHLLPTYPVVTILPYFGAMYTIQNSSNNDDLYSPVTGNKESFDERPTFSYSTGLLLGYNFTKRLTVFVGCTYNEFSSITHRENLQTIPVDQWGADSVGAVYTSSGKLTGMDYVIPSNEMINPYFAPETGMSQPLTSITQTFGFIEVPVLVRYKFFGPKVGLTLTGGMSTGFLVRNQVFAENNQERIVVGQTDNIRNFNLNAHFGVGIEAQILPWLYFNFEPTVRYSFLNWSMDPQVKMNPVMFSANTGFALKF